MFMIVNPEPRDCKICSGPSPLFGVVDFHKSCIEAQGNRLPLSGRPIYYRRCTACGFAFTDEFDDWSAEAFLAHIYNSSYIHVDPDYASARPISNATAIANTFLASRDSIAILDFGGGNGVFASHLVVARLQRHNLRSIFRIQRAPIAPLRRHHLLRSDGAHAVPRAHRGGNVRTCSPTKASFCFRR